MIDWEELKAAAQRLVDGFVALGAGFTIIADALTMLAEKFFDAVVRLFAVRKLDIPESDIRFATMDEVRLWNHRRIPIRFAEVLSWAQGGGR